MHISAPAKFNFAFLDKLKGKIHDTFGSINNDPGETVFPSYALPVISLEKLREYIEYSHSLNIRFNYIINHPGLSLNKERVAFFDKLRKMKVDIITVSNHKLIAFLKKEYPFEICTSVASKIDSLDKSLMYRDLGCDILCLDYSKNNDFEFIREVKTKTGLRIKLLANNICLSNCPYRQEHFEKGYGVERFEKQVIKCLKLKLNDLSLIRATGFIHPNNVEEYEKIGVDFLKLASRTKPPDWVINCVTAYYNKSYTGNCFKLMNNSVIETRYATLFKFFCSFLPNSFIRKGAEALYYLTNRKIFHVLSREQEIAALLKVYLTDNMFYMDDKDIFIEPRKKKYLLKEINKVYKDT